MGDPKPEDRPGCRARLVERFLWLDLSAGGLPPSVPERVSDDYWIFTSAWDEEVAGGELIKRAPKEDRAAAIAIRERADEKLQERVHHQVERDRELHEPVFGLKIARHAGQGREKDAHRERTDRGDGDQRADMGRRRPVEKAHGRFGMRRGLRHVLGRRVYGRSHRPELGLRRASVQRRRRGSGAQVPVRGCAGWVSCADARRGQSAGDLRIAAFAKCYGCI